MESEELGLYCVQAGENLVAQPVLSQMRKQGVIEPFFLRLGCLLLAGFKPGSAHSLIDTSLQNQLILKRTRGLEFSTPPPKHSLTTLFCCCCAVYYNRFRQKDGGVHEELTSDRPALGDRVSRDFLSKCPGHS